MTFLRCIEEHGYIIHVAEILARYVDASSSNLTTACLDFVVLDKLFDCLRAYGNFDYWVKETVFDRRLRTCWDNSYFIN